MGRGMGAATRGGGCVSGSGDRPKFAKGGSVASPRSGSQGLAKRGYKRGGAVMDADDHPMKKAMGGMIAPGAAAGTASGALQNQGAIIGAKKRKKTTRLGMLKAPSQPMPSPGGGSFAPIAGGNALPK